VKKILATIVLCLIGAVATAGAASADVTLCNKTSGKLQIALAHPVTIPYVTKEISGWWQIEPYTCSTPIQGDLGMSFPLYYFIAQSDGSVYQPRGEVAEYQFCITTDAFVRRGSWTKLQNICPAGWITRNFYYTEVPPGNLTINLN
jgi:uncharacterized membrane protein